MGLFVTLEGGEGAGKTELARALAARLVDVDVAVTFEPGGTPLGAVLRERLFDEAHPLSPWAETFLFLADRATHVTEVIRPALARGSAVICDRFADSTVAYQGYGRQLDPTLIEALNRQAAGGLVPHLTFFLDVPIQQGLDRSQRARDDRIGREPIDFHRRVAEGFKQLALKEPDRIHTLDAARPADEVLEMAWMLIKPRLAMIGHRTSE